MHWQLRPPKMQEGRDQPGPAATVRAIRDLVARSSERPVDGGEGVREAFADGGQRSDNNDRNERSDKAVFDGRGAGLVFSKTRQDRLHWRLRYFYCYA